MITNLSIVTHFFYLCKVPGCFHENRQYPLNDTWNETPCKQCHCTEDGVYCTFTNCPQLEDCEITYVPEGDCCPKCFEASEPNGEDPAFVVDVEENGCITDDGQMLQEGEVINPGPCRICKCKEESIMCEEKMCEPLVCHDDQVYAITDEECCPKCMGELLFFIIIILPDTFVCISMFLANPNYCTGCV